MIELGALRAVNERLKPLRRFMDDLQLATGMLGEVEGQVSDRQTAVGHLEAQIQDRQHELNDLSANRLVATDLFDKERADMQAAKHLAQAELTAFREGLEREKRVLQQEADEKRHATWQEYDSYMRALQAEKQVVAAEYDSLCAARNALKAEVRSLL